MQQLVESERLGQAGLKRPIVFYTINVNDLDDGEKAEPIMADWQVKSFTRTSFEFQLVFREPLTVSTKEEPDLLLVQIELCDLS